MGAIQAVKGTRDILPAEVGYWQQVEAVAAQILHRAAYQEMRPPVLEHTELFERGIGEATDVVSKEMYTFDDRATPPRSLTLRPEVTAGLVRAFIQNSLHTSGGVQRIWCVGPVFRYENPQAGRQRQFHQLDVEAIGSGDPRADVEVIAIATDILNSLGLTKLHLDLNSVGNREDRQHYREALVNYFTPYQNELDKDSQERLGRNPLRILDSKDKRTQEIAQGAPNILDYLSADSQRHFDRVQQLLNVLGINYQLNPRLVRGLDYYTHTAFEIISDDLGAQATVCGGGRYDSLVQELGGPDTPAVGWGMGLERLILLLQQKQIVSSRPDFYIVSRGEQAEAQALVLAQKLRTQFSVELDLSGSKFAKQFKRADRSAASACLVLGEAEAASNTVQLKWMASGEQQELSQAQLLAMTEQLREQLALHHREKEYEELGVSDSESRG
ncbi:MAG: histidine--tRNA ligase [Cyanophyceae cyanobacterium]